VLLISADKTCRGASCLLGSLVDDVSDPLTLRTQVARASAL
jgi:hypothetical protein